VRQGRAATDVGQRGGNLLADGGETD